MQDDKTTLKKEYMKGYMKNYRASHKDKIREYSKNWINKNKQKKKEYNKNWMREVYYKNPENIERRKINSTEQYLKNKNTIEFKKSNLIRVKKWFKEHPEQVKARDKIKYEVKMGRMLKASNLKCVICGNQAKQYHHYKGYSKENILLVIPLCVKCHYKQNRGLKE